MGKKRTPSKPPVDTSGSAPAVERDWRLVAVSSLLKEWHSPFTGTTHPAGSVVQVACSATWENKIIEMAAPSPVAMLISVARKHRDQARTYLQDQLKTDLQQSGDVFRIPTDKETDFYDCLENLQAAVVFSYTSIEAFANESIPRDFVYTVDRRDKRCTEQYDREQVERFVNLETKLVEILPGVFDVPAVKGKKLWERFRWLQDLRNSLVHLKAREHRGGGGMEYRILTRLLDHRTLHSPDVARDVIRSFCGKKWHPNWVPYLEKA